MKEFKQGEFAEIVYLSEAKQETTERVIIPTFVPKQTMKSIDVTDLSYAERMEMQELYAEFAKYYEDYLANAFNFETWVEHSKGKVISPKWRAFKLSNIKDVR